MRNYLYCSSHTFVLLLALPTLCRRQKNFSKAFEAHLCLCHGSFAPRLQLDPTYTEASATDVKWHDALCQNITFVPWEDFDGIIANTRKKLQGIDKDFHRGAEIILKANDCGVPREDNGADSLEGSTGHSNLQKREVDDVLTLGYFVQLFSDSTSTDGLHDNVFRATCLLLRGLQKDNRIQMIQRGYPSQLGMEFDAEGEHLPHHITLKPDRVLVSQSGSRLESLPVSTFEWKGPGLDFTCMGGDSGSASDLQMRLLLEEAVRQSPQDSSEERNRESAHGALDSSPSISSGEQSSSQGRNGGSCHESTENSRDRSNFGNEERGNWIHSKVKSCTDDKKYRFQTLLHKLLRNLVCRRYIIVCRQYHQCLQTMNILS